MDNGSCNSRTEICVDNYNFERLVYFRYLHWIVAIKSDNTIEIKQWTIAASRCYFGRLKQMEYMLTWRLNKCTLYNELINLLSKYVVDIWTITRVKGIYLIIFGKQFYKKYMSLSNLWQRYMLDTLL